MSIRLRLTDMIAFREQGTSAILQAPLDIGDPLRDSEHGFFSEAIWKKLARQEDTVAAL